MNKIGASDKLDKDLIYKYSKVQTVLKENYQNKKRKNTKKYYKKNLSVCEDKYIIFHKYKSFLKEMKEQTEEYKKLKNTLL